MGRAIVVGHKSQDALTQVREGDPTGASEQATNQDAKPDLNLVEPGAMPGRVDKAKAMGRVREKGGARLHRGQMATFALDAQVLLDATPLGHQAHQGLRLMGVELVGNEDPGGMWIGLDRLDNVRGEVGFGARGSQAGSHHLTGGHIQVGDQTQGAMAFIFEFLPLDVTGQHGQRWVEAFEGLDAGHLIGAVHMRARRRKRGGRFIHLTHGADLFGQLRGVVGGWSQPIALAMRL
jgi:hypothetical protein